MGVAVRQQSSAPALEAGHNRGSDAPSEAQPRVPIIGLDAGCIPGTRPGCSARELERAGRDIARSRMENARKKLRHRG